MTEPQEHEATEVAVEPAAPVAELVAPVAADSPLEKILEALLLASDQPLSLDQLGRLLGEELGVGRKEIREALERLDMRLQAGASELTEVASGFRIQVRADYAEWVARLWQEKPQKFSRALLETLALVCYRQPITRGEIEEIRGVQVSSNILRTLLERGWVRELGVKEVPGRPALFGTTPQFLDDFNLKSLDQLPSLPEIKDLAQLDAALAQLTGELPHAGDEDQAVESTEETELEQPVTADAAPVEEAELPGIEPDADEKPSGAADETASST
ncbi:SMC-Scp complex subunit ScpB [Hydrocarboniphaga sp.]|uniref:SMC-Scp complex subunit ScpB n=1 Tax=Hydrocarboniphaga sp. TaxID=2033016 RepID=UPI003D10234E